LTNAVDITGPPPPATTTIGQGPFMKKRNPVAVALILPIVTIGIYPLVWLVKTKTELNTLTRGAVTIPTAWVWFIPLVGYIWWLARYSEAVTLMTKRSSISTFLWLFFLGSIGMGVRQSTYNHLSAR
jgi:hypothetical protein